MGERPKRIWTCPICGEEMPLYGSLRSGHIRKHVFQGDKVPEDVVQEDAEWICGICGMGSSHVSKYKHKRYHAEAGHNLSLDGRELGENEWRCGVCGEIFGLKAKGKHMLYHLKRGEGVPHDKINRDAEWVCDICRFGINSESREYHMRIHRKLGHTSPLPEPKKPLVSDGGMYEGPPWECPICGMKMATIVKSMHLDAHRRAGYNPPPDITTTMETQCWICGDIVEDNIFARHMALHKMRGDKPEMENRREKVMGEKESSRPREHEVAKGGEKSTSPLYRACPECKVIYRLDNKDHWFCMSCGGKLTEGWITQEIRSATGSVGKKDEP